VPVNRCALDKEATQQDAKRLGVGERTPPVGSGNSGVEEPAEAELIKKMVEDWERAEASDLELKMRVIKTIDTHIILQYKY